MPAAARFRLCCRVSACAGASARSSMSPAKSASIIVFCGVPSTSFLCQLEAVFFDFINRCSAHVDRL